MSFSSHPGPRIEKISWSSGSPQKGCFNTNVIVIPNSHPGPGKVVLGQQRRDDDGGAPGFSGRNRSNTGGLEAALTKGTSREEHCVEFV